MTRHITVLLAGAGVLCATACNDHPLQQLEQVVSAVDRKVVELPPKTEIDFLFVVDNSGSMCEEQRNLNESFRVFSEFLFQELGDQVDYRIAVTSTDLQDPMRAGRLLNEPAAPQPALNCRDAVTGEPVVPATDGCGALKDSGQLPTVLRSQDVVDQADLEQKVRCLTTLGTQGDGFEKGLEAMRLALSCAGPNADLFSQCCTDAGDFDIACVVPETAVVECGTAEYQTLLASNPEADCRPIFLRPDAILVVVFVTDEDDCSDAVSNPRDSNLAICRYGPNAADQNGDGISDGYEDPEICGDKSPAQCRQDECGQLSPQECFERTCVINRGDNSNCEWFRSVLVPPTEYADFLRGLKLEPAESIIVASVAGRPDLTEAGNEITYNRPEVPTNPICNPDHPDYNREAAGSEVCCPGGNCEGPIQPACESANGIAFSGRRYNALVSEFGINGIGCPEETAVKVDQCAASGVSPCTEPCSDNAAESCEINCVNICEDDLSVPLAAIRDRIGAILNKYCLDKVPLCLITDPATGESTECTTEAERANSNNYDRSLRVLTQECIRDAEGSCTGDYLEAIARSPAEWDVTPNDNCTGGALLEINPAPTPGSRVFIDFVIEVGAEAGSSAPDGQDAGAGPAQQGAGGAAGQGMLGGGGAGGAGAVAAPGQ
jgi:hypothetical protein